MRERTGASIEIPGAASGERVFVHLGPGPARDIISSLVYGTAFDYVIETAEDDPDTLRSVVLTAPGQGDSSSDVVVAGATNSGEGSGDQGSTLAATAHRGGVTNSQARPEWQPWRPSRLPRSKSLLLPGTPLLLRTLLLPKTPLPKSLLLRKTLLRHKILLLRQMPLKVPGRRILLRPHRTRMTSRVSGRRFRT